MQLIISDQVIKSWKIRIRNNYLRILCIGLSIISIAMFSFYYHNGLGLAYNDARSHLDIGRRVLEGLKPGLAQIGSVWLPLPHLLMIPTIWIDWMWHSGLSGALVSMAAYVMTAIVIVKILEVLEAGKFAQLIAVLVFAFNLNVLYLQSTAMTELLLMFTMTAAAYFLLLWIKVDKIVYLINTGIFVMLASLTRYDGWFLFGYTALLVALKAWKSKGWRAVEGVSLIFSTMAALGIVMWFGWNIAIFGDPLYFISGPYSARSQQKVIEASGMLQTKGNWGFSLFTYTYDVILSIGIVPLIFCIFGLASYLANTRKSWLDRLASTTLLVPFFFNVLALYLGQSAIFLQGISADTWFNVRYGTLILPAVAIFVGYFTHVYRNFRPVLLVILIMVTLVSYTSQDAIAIDDALVGSSQKNVSEVSNWLKQNAAAEPGFVMISAASHDAILFSSMLPMKKFIHEGTGKYWESAGQAPDRWAKWLVMRTNDLSDQTFALMLKNGQLFKYELIASYPFADIYQLKQEYWGQVETEPTLGKQK